MEYFNYEFINWRTRVQADYKQKFKTEICRNWKQGVCEYGSSCIFAHGNHELRESSSKSEKKKLKCSHFHEQGYCQYGERCQFIHIDNSQDTAEDSSAPLQRAQGKESRKKRLPVFLKLSLEETNSNL